MKYIRQEIAPSEIERQRDICAQIRSINSGKGVQYALVDTYGCQQNESDSEIIKGYLSEMGYEFTDDTAKADVIAVNTCAVREHAEMRVLGNVGALVHTKRKRPGQLVALCGCMVQQPQMAERVRKSYRVVDIVFGPHETWKFPELLYRALTGKDRVFAAEPSDGVVAEGMPRRRDSSVKAWLSIMNGCNNFCSYCIVPYVRGRERSRRPEDVLAEARELAEAGYKDITLLGQNVNSYGKDLDCGVDFSDLLSMINEIPGDFVIRFMTSHPKDATDKLFETMARCEKVERHIHLPLQSGSDRILKIMNRIYTAEDYAALVERARRIVPGIVITTDIIVGFPGETEEDFEQTIAMAQRIRFDAMFTFIYSRRAGTPAAAMDDPVSRKEKQIRFDRLLEVQNAISAEIHNGYVGKTMRVLIDGESRQNDGFNLTSRTQGGRLVHLNGPTELIGSFAEVKVTEGRTWALFGEMIGRD